MITIFYIVLLCCNKHTSILFCFQVLSPTGVPVYFTMFAQNSQGSRSSVTCKLHTYDVTLPSGRFEAEFATSSNPHVLKSSVVVHDDSPIVESFVAIGFGEGIYGDQIKPFTPTNLDARDFSIDIGMHFDIDKIMHKMP